MVQVNNSLERVILDSTCVLVYVMPFEFVLGLNVLLSTRISANNQCRLSGKPQYSSLKPAPKSLLMLKEGILFQNDCQHVERDYSSVCESINWQITHRHNQTRQIWKKSPVSTIYKTCLNRSYAVASVPEV